MVVEGCTLTDEGNAFLLSSVYMYISHVLCVYLEKVDAFFITISTLAFLRVWEVIKVQCLH